MSYLGLDNFLFIIFDRKYQVEFLSGLTPGQNYTVRYFLVEGGEAVPPRELDYAVLRKYLTTLLHFKIKALLVRSQIVLKDCIQEG